MSEKQFDFPTEVVDLPSKGLLYPEGHPLRKGNIEIKYMTAREEDILASQSLIKKGVVLDKLFESVVVEPDVDINLKANEYITKLQNNQRRIPTIVFEDDTFLVEPSDVELELKLKQLNYI